MIYFTTFILTLLFAHIARAVPGCGDDAYPEEVYDPTYDNGQEAFPAVINPVKVTVTGNTFYDNWDGNTSALQCRGLGSDYPRFKDIPHFPYIGGKVGIPKSGECGWCWTLTYKGNLIRVTVVNSVGHDTTYDISKEAYNKLGGSQAPGKIEANAELFTKYPCLQCLDPCPRQ